MPRLDRDRLTWLVYGQLAAFGYFFYGFGPVVPLLRDEQHTSRGIAGLHGTAFALGGIVGGALTPRLVRRFGRQTVVWTGLAGVSAGVLGLWVAHALWATIALAGIISVFACLLIVMATTVLSDRHGPAGPAVISEANAVAAGVGLLAPLVVGALLAVLALALKIRIPPAPPAPVTVLAGRLPRAYGLVWVCLIATGSIEVCLNLWVADVLRTHSHAAPGVATAAVSAIVAGMCVARLGGSRLLLRWSAPRVLLGAFALSAVGFTVFWFAPSTRLALAGLVVLGLGNGMHFPLGIALAVAHSGGQPDLAVSRASYATGLAFGVSPFALGAIADRVGPHTAFLLLPVCLLLAASMVTRLARLPASGHGDAVADRQQHRLDPLVGEHELVEVDDRPVGGGAGVEDPAGA
jgi:MFS family permease